MHMEQERKIKKNVIISCKDLYKEFKIAGEKKSKTSEGVKKVVGGFNLEVNEGEFLVLFGPGQSGKTTILNMIAGFEQPTSGTILMKDKLVEKPHFERGVVFQTMAIFPWLTVLGNVEYGLKMRGVDKKTRQEKAQYFINLVGLEGFENSYPIQLSGGMKQRVGIARAYCSEPQVILMDEPFSALDAQTRYLMQDEIIRIWEAEKRTIIFITNNIEEAVYLADRIVVTNNCPTSVKAEYDIDLSRPRSYIDERFLKLRREINSVVDHTL